MTYLDYALVDVFADRPFAGNSLPVFTDIPKLSSRAMLAITRELRHFEAIFLSGSGSDRVREVRVFDLFEELPFAGHPVIGAAATLQHRAEPRRSGVWRLKLPAKEVHVEVEPTSFGYSAVLDQGEPQLLGVVDQRSDLASPFGLCDADLVTEVPIEIGTTGLAYAVIPVRKTGLAKAKLSRDITGLLAGVGAQFAVLVDPDSGEMRHWNNDGVLEDAATGSAAGVVASYLVRHDLRLPNASFELRQGRYVDRASVLRVEVTGQQHRQLSVHVGGGVVIVGDGRVRVPNEFV